MPFRMTCLQAAITVAFATSTSFAFAAPLPDAGKLTEPNQPGQMLTTEQAFEAEILEVAKAQRVSPNQARSILNIEAQSGEIVAAIRERYKNRLAGIFIEHNAEGHRLVVRLKGAELVPKQSHQFGDDVLIVDFQPGATHTVNELVAALNTVTQGDVAASIPGAHGGYVDERTGELVIEVNPNSEAGKGSAAVVAREMVQKLVGVPVRIEKGEAAEIQAVFGSGTLGNGCTAGFTVNHAASGLQGVLTAGHCQTASGSDTYSGIDGATATLEQKAGCKTLKPIFSGTRERQKRSSVPGSMRMLGGKLPVAAHKRQLRWARAFAIMARHRVTLAGLSKPCMATQALSAVRRTKATPAMHRLWALKARTCAAWVATAVVPGLPPLPWPLASISQDRRVAWAGAGTPAPTMLTRISG